MPRGKRKGKSGKCVLHMASIVDLAYKCNRDEILGCNVKIATYCSFLYSILENSMTTYV